MAKITPYQQGQLASSAVGVPSPNLSGSQVFEQAGHDLGQLGAAQHQQYLTEVRTKQAEQRALQKHMDDMARQTQVINIASGAQVEMQKSMNDLQMKYRDNPEQAVQEFDALSQQKIQATLQTATDPETNQMLQQKLAGQHASDLEKLGNWQRERQVPIAEQNLKNSAGSLSMTTGQMAGSNPNDIKTTIDKYNQDTHNQYQFYHQKGLSGQFDVSSDAVKEYLEATAAGGDPVLLEQRIKEFADGRYISPSDLQSVAIQQRGIAAQVRLANNTEQTKVNQASKMSFIDQLMQAGNGDIHGVRPDVAQQIYNANAPKMSPGDRLAAKEMIARDVVEARGREASEKALETALNAPGNKTGKLEGTPPEVIQKILQDKNLTKEDRDTYTKLLAKTSAAGKVVDYDKTLSQSIGVAAAGASRLAIEIHQDLLNLGKIKNPKLHAEALTAFEFKMQRYQEAYISLHDAQDSIRDPHVKALVNLHIKNAQNEFGEIQGTLSNSQGALEMKKAKDSFYSKIAPQQNMFPDPRQQQYYNYLHKQLFYNLLITKKFSAKDMDTLENNASARQAIQNDLSKQTASWMHTRGLTP